MKKFYIILCAVILFCGIPKYIEATHTEISLPAEADTYITGYSGADVNYGQENNILVRASSYRQALIRFDLKEFPKDAGSIYLKLYKNGGGADEVCIAVGKNVWEENVVTYRSYGGTILTRADAVASARVLESNGWIAVDVTKQVRDAGDKITFIVFDPEGEQNNIRFAARELDGYAPSLTTIYDYTPRPQSVEVFPAYYGQKDISIPLESTVTIESKTIVRDQMGQVMEVMPRWELAEKYDGIVMNQDGTWLLSHTAKEGPVTVTASYEGYSGTYTYQLHKQTNIEKRFPDLLYGEEDLPLIRKRLKTEPFVSRFNESYKRKDRYSMERLDNAVGINAWRTQSVRFHTPKGTKKVKILLKLSGKGNIRMDMLEINGLNIQNSGFENGLYGWTQATGEGSIAVKRKSDAGFNTADNCGVYYASIEHSDKQQESVLSQEIVAMEDMEYYGKIILGQDQENSGGFSVIAQMLDEQGNMIGQVVAAYFQRMTITKRVGLTTEHLANVYMGMGSDGYYYAEKAKKLILYSLWEMRWGMNHLMMTGESLDDTYEAVHIGRAVKNICYYYDQIKNVPVEHGGISPEEENQIREHLYWIADTLMDTKYYNYTDETRRRHNYNADRSVGLLIFSIMFPYYYRADEYYNHAVGELEWMLENSVGMDGGWPESTRYHAAVLKSFGFAAKVIRRATGEDWFQNERLKAMYRFLLQIQMPRDRAAVGAWNGRADYPPIGDADYSEVQGCIYNGIEGYAHSDPLFAAQLQFALDREGGGIDDWLYMGPEDMNMTSPVLDTMCFPDMGYIAFRQDYGTRKEDYALFYSSGHLIGSHQHDDRGSFIIYSDEIPISLDSGMCGYGAKEARWYESAAAHNTVGFVKEDGTLYPGSQNASLIDFFHTDICDYARSDIGGSGTDSYQRHFAFLKNGLDAYVVWDAISSPQSGRFGVHALAPQAECFGNTVTAECYGQKIFDITFLLPENAVPHIQQTPLSNTTRYEQDYQQYITLEAAANEDFLVILDPHDSTEKKIETMQIDQNVYQISREELYAYIMINPEPYSAVVTLQEHVVQSGTQNVYFANSEILLNPGEMKICFPVADGEFLVNAVKFYQGNTEITNLEDLKNGQETEIRTNIISTSYEDENVTLYYAVFDKNQILTKIDSSMAVLKMGEEKELVLSNVVFPQSTEETFKIFLWNNNRPIQKCIKVGD